MEGKRGAVAVRVADDVAHLVVDGDDEAALDVVPVERVGSRMSGAERVSPLKSTLGVYGAGQG